MTVTRARPTGRPKGYQRRISVSLDEETKAWVELMADYFAISESDFVRHLIQTMRRQPANAVATATALRQKETNDG